MRSELISWSVTRRAKNSWLLSFGDTLTLLICFFIVMIIKSHGDVSRVHSFVYNELYKCEQKLISSLSEVSDIYVITRDTRGVKITINSSKVFMPSKAEPNKSYKRELTRLSKTISNLDIFYHNKDLTTAYWIKEFENNGLIWKPEIRIEGHTDNVPIISGSEHTDNWELSAARAQKIMKTIQTNTGLPGRIFAVAGFGEQRPLISNSSEYSRELNRRVELYINASLTKK